MRFIWRHHYISKVLTSHMNMVKNTIFRQKKSMTQNLVCDGLIYLYNHLNQFTKNEAGKVHPIHCYTNNEAYGAENSKRLSPCDTKGTSEQEHCRGQYYYTATKSVRQTCTWIKRYIMRLLLRTQQANTSSTCRAFNVEKTFDFVKINQRWNLTLL